VTYLNRDDLVEVAARRAHQLVARSNAITKDHGRLLDGMAELFVDAALGTLSENERGRLVVSAPVGTGKTSTVLAVAETLHLHADPNVGLLVLQQRVEEGQAVREALLQLFREAGRPGAGDVGHVHSKGGMKPKGLTVEEGASRRFVLATHTRARMPEVAQLVAYQGRRRGVIIDEALRTSWADGRQVSQLDGAIAWGIARFQRDKGRLAELSDWLVEVRLALDEGLHLLKESDGDVYFPIPRPPSTRDASSWCRRLENYGQLVRKAIHQGVYVQPENHGIYKRSEFGMAQDLVRLIEGLSIDVRCRLVETGQRTALLQHRHVVPQELDDAIILDAGAEADDMTQLDDQVRLVHDVRPERFPEEPAAVKDWSSVRVDWVQTPGGRKSTTDAARGAPSASAAMFEYASAWIAHERPHKVLAITFKDTSAERALPEALRERNYDGKVEVLTWGRHDATNAHQDADAVVLLGVLQLDTDVARAMILGQLNQPESPVPTAKEVTGVKRGHEATSIYQALGRGCCRQQGEDGRAKPMKVLLFQEFADVTRRLRRLMPGVDLHHADDWRKGRKAGHGGAPRRRAGLELAIREHLDRLAAAGTRRITAKDLRATVGPETARKTFWRATEDAIERSGWVREDRTLVHRKSP
jgi:hypothetical protein